MSFHSPVCWSLERRPVARENLETEMPLGVNLVSASLPMLPSRITLLTLLDAILTRTVSQLPLEGRPLSLPAGPGGGLSHTEGAGRRQRACFWLWKIRRALGEQILQ